MHSGRKTRHAQKERRAFTLVELLTALAIMSVLSVAVTSILMGAAKTDLYVSQETAAVQEAETAFRRILHNLRTASAITAPATVGAAAGTLTVVTQPDSANANATYTVTYALSGTTLTESDPRYNVGTTPSTIARNVSQFEITRNAASPQTVTVKITIGTRSPVTRSATICCRNL